MANIVEAVGTAATTKKGTGRRVEQAMANAVQAVSRESEAIWKDESLSLEERNKRIAELNKPETIRARMLAARDAERAKIREEAAEEARRSAAEAEAKAAEETAANIAAREEATKATKH